MSSNVNITVFNSKAAQEAAERAELAATKAENIKFLNLKSEIPAPAGLVLPTLDPIGNPVVDGMFMEVNKGNYTNVDSTALAVVKDKGRLYFNQTKWAVALEWDLPNNKIEIEKNILGGYLETPENASIYFQGNYFLKTDNSQVVGSTWANLKIPVDIGDIVNFLGYSYVSSTPDSYSFTFLKQSENSNILNGVLPIVVDSGIRSLEYKSDIKGFVHINIKVKNPSGDPLSYTCTLKKLSYEKNGAALLRRELGSPNGAAKFDEVNSFIRDGGIIEHSGVDIDVTENFYDIKQGKVLNADGTFSDAGLSSIKIYRAKKGDIFTFNGNAGGSDTSPSNKFPVLLEFNNNNEFVGVIGFREKPYDIIETTIGSATRDGYVYVNTRPQEGILSTIKINQATDYSYVPKGAINKAGGVVGTNEYLGGDKNVFNSTSYTNGLMKVSGLVPSSVWANLQIPVKKGDLVSIDSHIDSLQNPMGIVFNSKGKIVEVIRATTFNENVLHSQKRFIREDGTLIANSKKTTGNYKVSISSGQGVQSQKISNSLTDLDNGRIGFGVFNISPSRWTVLQALNSFTFKPLVFDQPTYSGFRLDKRGLKSGDRIRIKATVTSPNGFKLYLAKYDKPLVLEATSSKLLAETTSGNYTLDVSFVYSGEIYFAMKASDYSSQVNIVFSNVEVTNESFDGKFVKTEESMDINRGEVKTIRRGGMAKLNTSFFNDTVDVDYFKAYPTASQSNAFLQNPMDIDERGEVMAYSDVNGDIMVGYKEHEWNDYRFVNLFDLFPDVFISQTDDSHHSLNVVFTKSGHIIITGNMHISTCRCAITTNPYDISSWRLIKYTENTVTYPAFVKNSNKQLMVFFREGMSGDGDFYYSYFNDTTLEFENKRQVINGTDTSMTGTGNSLSPYPNQIIIDKNDKIRILLGFRIDHLGANRNMGMYYLESADWGQTWTKSDGVTPYTLPTHATTLERVIDIPVGTGYVNQAGSCMGHDGNFYSAIWQDVVNGANTYTQILIIKNVGGVWSSEIVTNNTFKNVFLEGGGLLYKSNRPIMFCDSKATYVIQKSADDRQTAYAIDVKTKEKKVLFRFPTKEDYYFEFAMSQNHLKKNILCLVTPKEFRRDYFEYFIIKKYLY